MEQITSVIIGACMLSLAVGIAHMIRPSKAFEQQVRFLISMLFVVCIASPFLDMELPELDAVITSAQTTAQPDALAEETRTQMLYAAQQRTEAAVVQYLAANGIACSEVTASMHIDAAGSISISEVSVMCSPSETAAALLQSVLGEGVTLCVAEASS